MNCTFTSWDSELYHHGIKGQKWGIRRYQNEDGSLTSVGRKHYGYGENLTKAGKKQYIKEYRKLQKLNDRANIDLQRQKAQNYDKRAKVGSKVASIAGGIATAGVGLSTALKLINNRDKALTRSRLEALDAEGSRLFQEGYDATIGKYATHNGWSNDKAVAEAYDKAAQKYIDLLDANEREYNGVRSQFNERANSRKSIAEGSSTVSKIAAGVATVSLGYAAYNKVQAKLSRYRMTEAGHSKAVQRAEAQVQKMQKMFGDVKLEEIMNNK